MNLKNKVAIVTGSRRGIGKAIALALAKAGANVVVSDINIDDCNKVVEEIKDINGNALAVKADVSNPEDVSKMINLTTEKFGKVDILVNNAGIYMQKSLTDVTEQDFDRILDINLKGVFLCSKAAVPEMIKQGKGKIINIASIAGQVGFANSSAYCASKGGIINMTRELALELGQYKINVNAIGPGVIETPMTKDLLEDKATKETLLANIPLNRIGKPEDIANAALFLASDNSDYITGITLFVDGGWLAH
ncbi:3-oxoacyl-ACP reductase FabG [Candidatus Woesearchaeota archaeon]|nr:3-oxoacyl-ACP reductase FabG [Candidatus Woesearchaeota archaeon]MBU3941557.1 3-oxoacyl-ACP reductase FabG [Nanoarchaeota archaeon]